MPIKAVVLTGIRDQTEAMYRQHAHGSPGDAWQRALENLGWQVTQFSHRRWREHTFDLFDSDVICITGVTLDASDQEHEDVRVYRSILNGFWGQKLFIGSCFGLHLIGHRLGGIVRLRQHPEVGVWSGLDLAKLPVRMYSAHNYELRFTDELRNNCQTALKDDGSVAMLYKAGHCFMLQDHPEWSPELMQTILKRRAELGKPGPVTVETIPVNQKLIADYMGVLCERLQL